jgi:hypothetical protein
MLRRLIIFISTENDSIPSLFIRQSTFVIRHSFRLPAEKSDASRPPVKADGYRLSLDNDRDLAGTIGMLQHGVYMFWFFNHIIILHLPTLFGKRFTSGPGVRSSILSKKQNFIRHFFSLFNLNGLDGVKNVISNNCK